MVLLFLCLLFAWILSEKFLPYEKYPVHIKMIARSIIMIPLFVQLFQYQFDYYTVSIMAIMGFVLLSDIMLLIKFEIGAVSFLITHILLIIYMFIKLPYIDIEQIVILFIILFIFLFIFKVIFYKKTSNFNMVIIVVYFFVLSVELWRAYILASYTGNFSHLMLYLGCTFFVLCDIQVCYLSFVGKHWKYQEINHFTYYTGLLLITLSAG